MATIYRFVVENKATRSSGRKSSDGAPSKKSAAKKGRWVSIFGGEKGGVEHNRKMRAINPLLNKLTGGWYEKGMRLGRAGAGLIKRNTKTGALAWSGTAIAIILAFVIQVLLKWQSAERQKAQKLNAQNFKQMENGVGTIHSQYSITTNYWNGRRTFNENK